ncbi:MAG: hypothetical protein JWM05_3404, partial [Acidimicrobiales bacterium]|nr:hypothetical protein [Acidimicrobiales bacterium]
SHPLESPVVHPLDEFPIHQAPLSMAEVVTSDRNAYDRYYFNAHGRSGDPFLLTGLGIYPNLGVVDAFATVRTGDRQVSVRASGSLDGCDRLAPAVGPFRVEVIEPLQRLRLVCDADDHGLGFDLTWDASFPAVDEAPHLWRQGRRVTLDAQRFAQVGAWDGTLRVEGNEIAVTPDTWVGTRDRSWGIRPVGEPEPPGRAGDTPTEGFWWLYLPLRFDDFALVVIVQEDPDGHRVLNDATRVWPAASGRPPEQLGWPEVDVHYRSGTRIPTGVTVVLRERGGRPLTLEVESCGYVALNAGSGYGGDPSWSHGAWKGDGWVEGVVHDLADPAVAGMIPFGLIDHVGKANLDGAEGWGLFEHGAIGRHDPSGFADYGSVAP